MGRGHVVGRLHKSSSHVAGRQFGTTIIFCHEFCRHRQTLRRSGRPLIGTDLEPPNHLGAFDRMLEEPSLCLQFCQVPSRDGRSASGSSRICRIVAGLSQQFLGFAERLDTGPRHWPWAGYPVVAVHEAEDEPLLFTVHRLWGWRSTLEVRDADGLRVGTIRPGFVRDRHGNGLARLVPEANGSQFLGAGGEELGTLRQETDGVLVSFAPVLDNNPFAKMLLLAAALTVGSLQ